MGLNYTQKQREEYENDPIRKRIADQCFEVLAKHVSENTHIRPANDDRAENLVMAIYSYIIESEKEPA